MQFVDLSQSLGPDSPVFPGDPPPKFERIASVETDGYTVHRIDTGLHVGTHVDAPQHMLADGKPLSAVAVERYFGTGRLIDARGQRSIGPECLRGNRLSPGDIVLIWTGWSSHYGQPDYFTAYPAVSIELAKLLAAAEIHAVGMDTPSPDYPPHAIHKLLLKQDILIIENLTNLERLLDLPSFEVIALPAKVEADAAPVRVLAKVTLPPPKTTHPAKKRRERR